MRLQIVVLAAIIAPLVEETMFRGFLYRHLRDAGWRLPRLVSVLISGTVVSFLFAVIHPQGWTLVPALMGLALGFTLMREWRGSLIGPMIAHGINNSVALFLLIFAVAD
jgi:membrane protease YdiL (CAAX protease family)